MRITSDVGRISAVQCLARNKFSINEGFRSFMHAPCANEVPAVCQACFWGDGSE